MDNETWVFLWRMLLLSMSAFLLGMTAVISVRYYRHWRHRVDKHNWRGLLPMHVFIVTASYDLLLLYATIEIYLKIDDDADSATWRGLLLAPAYVLGFMAMYTIAKFRKQKKLVSNP